jgi:hypothetical protein
MSLFQESIIRKHLGYLDQDVVDKAYLRFKEVYSANKITNIRLAKEEQYQEGFIKDIFGAVLGYSVFPEQPFNIQTEKKNEADSKKADGAIFQGENVVGVIELKDNKTKNLDAVKDQAFGYKNNHKECSYVISSNFHKLRFYVDDATEYEEFDLYNLDKETFKRFYLYLRKEGLLDKNIPKLLRQETKFHEENISKRLYKDYSTFKNNFFQNVVKNNPQHDKLILFKKSQKFLDKVLFVLFAEDKGLVTTNSIVQIVEKWQDLKNDAFDTPKPLYELVALFFNNLFIGKKDQKGYVLIPEFGGEIFAPDEVLDSLNVDDVILKDDLLKLSKYDFNTDVDVNILGHIFEHSLSEIEEVEAELKGEVADKTKGKRKKDGVFYTPKYITKYIVENTIGKLCSDKKTEFKLDVDVNIFEYQKADGKLNAKGIALYETLNQYKAWLLTLKILDPACGSGAFLNQAVNFLIHEHQFIDDIISELTNTPLRLYDTDIAILENNIYGVDINEESVEIAKLSLWLRTAKQGRKLSNLSNNIKCGNSLIDDPAVAGDKAFNWQKEFPEVFANGGFDVVIGNPPYVRAENIEKVQRDYFISKNSKYSKTFGRFDLYIVFNELALQLLKPNGFLSFIFPSSFFNQNYSSLQRDWFLNELNLIEIADLSYIDVFNGVAVETAIVIVKNQLPTKTIICSKPANELEFLAGNKSIIDKSIFNNLPNKTFRAELDGIAVNLITKIRNNSNLLEDFCYVVIGAVPHNSITGASKDRLISTNCDKPTSRKYIEGKNVNRYSLIWDNRYIDYIPSEMHRPKFPELFENEKLLVRNISTTEGIMATYDDEHFYLNDTMSVLILWKNLINVEQRGVKGSDRQLQLSNEVDLKYLIALVNSKLVNFYFKLILSSNLHVYPEAIRNLPISNSKKINQNHFSNKVDLIISTKRELIELSKKLQGNLQRKFALEEISKKLQEWYLLSYSDFIKELGKKKVKLSLSEEAEWETYFTAEAKKALELKSQIDKTDKEIDQMVYALYELTEDEIKIVEES